MLRHVSKFWTNKRKDLETNTSWRINSTNKARVKIKVRFEISPQCVPFPAVLFPFVLVTKILVFYWNHAVTRCVRMIEWYYSLIDGIFSNITIPQDNFGQFFCTLSSLIQISHLSVLPVYLNKHMIFKQQQ